MRRDRGDAGAGHARVSPRIRENSRLHVAELLRVGAAHDSHHRARPVQHLPSIYRTIAAWGIFPVVASATLVAGFPFTLQYARARVPREIWNATAFLAMNVMRHHFHDGHDSRNAGSSRPLRFITRGNDPNSHPDARLRLQSFLPRYFRKRLDIASANVRSGNYTVKN